jgi:predicted N-formylglutamate amidohydrolase
MSAVHRFSLDTEEPPPFELVNATGRSELVLICDHADNRIPSSLQRLGLSIDLLSSHIAWDVGAADLARALSKRLDATLVLANYSRLLIDCNRHPAASDSIPVVSDGNRIPGNEQLSDEDRALRLETLFQPYHQEISRVLESRTQRRTRVVSVHSFTPVLAGTERPWSVGVCYNQSEHWASQWIAALESRIQEQIGDNQPYAIEREIDYTLPVHCEAQQIPCIMLEVRQDQIADSSNVQRWCELLAQCWLGMV